jgi:NADH-quinone oxidoreductase subunit C
VDGEATSTAPETVGWETPGDLAPLLGDVPTTLSIDQVVAHPTREQYVDLVTRLRTGGFWQCTDLTVVDQLANPNRAPLPEGVAPERYELVVHLLDYVAPRRLRLRVQVPADDPVCPTIVGVHPGAEAMEREAYDMFGLTFEGHPDPSRILMPDDWDGYPLRKDYAIGKIPVQFKETTSDQEHRSGRAAR